MLQSRTEGLNGKRWNISSGQREYHLPVQKGKRQAMVSRRELISLVKGGDESKLITAPQYSTPTDYMRVVAVPRLSRLGIQPGSDTTVRTRAKSQLGGCSRDGQICFRRNFITKDTRIRPHGGFSLRASQGHLVASRSPPVAVPALRYPPSALVHRCSTLGEVRRNGAC
jgi:hypothetical protein